MQTSTLTALPQPSIWLAKLALLAVACVWGTSYGLTKEALLTMSVFAFLTMRFGLTFLITIPMVWKEMRGLSGPQFLVGLLLGLNLFAIFCAETFGVIYLDASLAAVLISLCIVMTPILERVVLKVSINKSLLAAIPLSLVGILLISSEQIEQWSFNQGTWLILLAALLRALMSVNTKASFNRFSYSPIMITSFQSFVVMTASLLMLFLTSSGSVMEAFSAMDTKTGTILLYLVLFCTLFAFVGTNYGIKHAGPTQASFLMGLEPVFGIVFGMIFLAETLSILQWFGCSLVIFSTYMVLAKSK